MNRPPSIRSTSVPDVGVRANERTLALLRDLVQEHTGSYYDDSRLDLMRDRLAPLAMDRGLDSLLDYYYVLKYDEDADQEWVRALDALSVQETYFWREPDQFRALTDAILPRLAAIGRNSVRIWSVPCAGGEEPLSIAIALEEAGWFSRIGIELHASDASASALSRARERRYGARAFRQLPEVLRSRYFSQVGTATTPSWSVDAQLYARVTSWTSMNVIRDDHTARLAMSDVIFCRNLFIYFTPDGVRRVVDRFASLMPSPAFLCVGASESLLRLTTRFELQELAGAYVYVKP